MRWMHLSKYRARALQIMNHDFMFMMHKTECFKRIAIQIQLAVILKTRCSIQHCNLIYTFRIENRHHDFIFMMHLKWQFWNILIKYITFWSPNTECCQNNIALRIDTFRFDNIRIWAFAYSKHRSVFSNFQNKVLSKRAILKYIIMEISYASTTSFKRNLQFENINTL